MYKEYFDRTYADCSAYSCCYFKSDEFEWLHKYIVKL